MIKPLLDDAQLAQLNHIELEGFRLSSWNYLESPVGGLAEGHNSIPEPAISGKGLEAALDELFDNADAAIRDGVNILILSDRKVGKKAPCPPRGLRTAPSPRPQGTRTRVSLVLESTEPAKFITSLSSSATVAMPSILTLPSKPSATWSLRVISNSIPQRHVPIS